MKTKNKCGWRLLFASLFVLLGTIARVPATTTEQALTIEQLADICEKLESAITDISIEYEWLVDSTMTLREKLEFVNDEPWSIIVGPSQCKIVCSLAHSDPNDPNAPLFDRFLFEKSYATTREPNELSHHLIKRSYNGEIAKSLYIDYPSPIGQGIISKPDFSQVLGVAPPLEYFSIHRSKMSNVTSKMPLSAVLRLVNREKQVHLDNAVKQFAGFGTIRADLLLPVTKRPFMRVYFSVEHGYYPVGYEYLRGPEPEIVHATIQISSLEKVTESLWFPSGGALIDHESKYNEVNLYQATSKILVNQGLTEKDFDIVFPPGTKVHDQIKGVKYTIPGE
jgi:hypothetical protein